MRQKVMTGEPRRRKRHLRLACYNPCPKRTPPRGHMTSIDTLSNPDLQYSGEK